MALALKNEKNARKMIDISHECDIMKILNVERAKIKNVQRMGEYFVGYC